MRANRGNFAGLGCRSFEARPLLVFELTAVQGPEEHHQADDKTGGHVCNEVRVVHNLLLFICLISLIGFICFIIKNLTN
jgi:hypothetical protein